MNDIVIIALRYMERDYAQTLDCIQRCGLPVIWAERDGVGNYSRAFNEAFAKGATAYKYAWMISNIVFEPTTPKWLALALESNKNLAALHPAMASSDHKHQLPDGSDQVRDVPFIEWTAPMVRTAVFKRHPLVNELAYWYQDLQWCYEVRNSKGLGPNAVAVHHGMQVQHTYLRNNKKEEISRIRARLRELWKPTSRAWMEERYGKGWETLMQWKP